MPVLAAILDLCTSSEMLMTLTLALPRGIGVTLMTKGGAKWPFKIDRLYELAQMSSMIDLFFPYSALH